MSKENLCRIEERLGMWCFLLVSLLVISLAIFTKGNYFCDLNMAELLPLQVYPFPFI